MVKLNFNLAPREAIEYLNQKGYKTSFNYDEIAREAHNKSFTVAKMMKQDLLEDVLSSLDSALKEGKHFDEFAKEIKPTLQKKGWWGKQDILNPETGEVKEVNIGSSRLRHIYKTNMRVAYSKARYKEQMKLPNSTYLRYVSEMLGTSRESHKAIHNTVLPRDHAFWDTNTPINDHGCKCVTIAISAKEAQKQGLKISSIAPKSVASKDWAYNPAKIDKLDEIYKDKAHNIKDKAFAKVAKEQHKLNAGFVAQNLVLYKSVETLFTKKNKKVELCKSDIFESQKRVLLSSDTVQGHLDRKDITAFDYSLIPYLMNGRVFKQKDNTYVLLEKFGRYYRVALKNVKDKDEIYVVSLIGANSQKDYERWVRELNKFEEVQGDKR